MAWMHLDSSGSTLIEQLASLLIGSVLITSLYGYFRSELYHVLRLEVQTGTLEDARGALDIMIRDLREAGSWGGGTVPSELGGADDPNNDDDTICNRVYAASVTAPWGPGPSSRLPSEAGRGRDGALGAS